MKTQFYTACSLDGFLATPDDSLDWLLRLEAGETSYEEFIADVGAAVMGSATYLWLLRHLEASGEAWPYAQPTWVFTSRGLAAPKGADVRFARGDVATHHPAMVEAAAGKNVWVVGGGDLAGQFHDAGLLDEMIVQFAPVTLGKGKPLFPRRADFRPVEVRRFGVFVEVRYHV